MVLLPENPCERYQLVHDYLALFIRQQQEPKLKAVIEELEREKQQRKLAEEELQQALERELEREKKQRQETEQQLKKAEEAKNILAAAK